MCFSCAPIKDTSCGACAFLQSLWVKYQVRNSITNFELTWKTKCFDCLPHKPSHDVKMELHSPLTLSPLLKLISLSPCAECDRVAIKTRPGTALYRRLRCPAVWTVVVAGPGLRGEEDLKLQFKVQDLCSILCPGLSCWLSPWYIKWNFLGLKWLKLFWEISYFVLQKERKSHHWTV